MTGRDLAPVERHVGLIGEMEVGIIVVGVGCTGLEQPRCFDWGDQNTIEAVPLPENCRSPLSSCSHPPTRPFHSQRPNDNLSDESAEPPGLADMQRLLCQPAAPRLVALKHPPLLARKCGIQNVEVVFLVDEK